MTDTLTADGIPLDTFAQSVGLESNRWSVPGAKGENVLVPARHGSLWVSDKTFGEGEFSLDILVRGAQDNGFVPADQLAQTRDNIDRLLRLFTKRKKLIRFEQTYDSGKVIECYAECVGAFDVTRTSAALPYARMRVGFKVPSAFWQDASFSTFSSSAGITPGATLKLPPFEGGTAPMDDAIYILRGPISAPELYVYATGAYTRFSGVIPDGQAWRINAADWTSVRGTNVTFDSTGHTSIISTTVHGGSATLMDLPPLASNEIAIEINGTNTGANTQLEVRGRRKYLIS